ncbi:hypothetical protein LSAT2_002864 [Lamellibrachia satsuma]|nr:hypothetical protein LSAT2_002864 [Lamellibrachia satsuma]
MVATGPKRGTLFEKEGKQGSGVSRTSRGGAARGEFEVSDRSSVETAGSSVFEKKQLCKISLYLVRESCSMKVSLAATGVSPHTTASTLFFNDPIIRLKRKNSRSKYCGS